MIKIEDQDKAHTKKDFREMYFKPKGVFYALGFLLSYWTPENLYEAYVRGSGEIYNPDFCFSKDYFYSIQGSQCSNSDRDPDVIYCHRFDVTINPVLGIIYGKREQNKIFCENHECEYTETCSFVATKNGTTIYDDGPLYFQTKNIKSYPPKFFGRISQNVYKNLSSVISGFKSGDFYRGRTIGFTLENHPQFYAFLPINDRPYNDLPFGFFYFETNTVQLVPKGKLSKAITTRFELLNQNPSGRLMEESRWAYYHYD